MFTRACDIKFTEKDGFIRREDNDFYDYSNSLCKVFFYKNVVITVNWDSTDPENIIITTPCTLKEQYFPTSILELADTIKYEKMNARYFNMRDFKKSLDILDNISKTF